MKNIFTNHSGGAPGADIFWEREGKKYGVTTVAYSFKNHIQVSENQLILTEEELQSANDHLRFADRTLKRNLGRLHSNYVRNLLLRNWFQVKNSKSIFAIAKNITGTIVEGGTGCANGDRQSETCVCFRSTI